MESEIAYFLKNFIQLNTLLFLCFYTVWDSLRMPIRKIAVYTLSFDALFCLMIMIGGVMDDAGFFSLMGTVLFIIGSAWLLFRAVSHEKGALMFILLLVSSYIFFVDSLGNMLCLLFHIPLNDFGCLGMAIYLLCLVVTVYPFDQFMGWLWTHIRGLREASWNRLCLVPLAFIVMGSMHRKFFVAEMITGWAFPVFEIMIIVCAFIVYWQIADGLSKADNNFAERLRNTDNQLLLQAELLNEATSREGANRQLRHDMRHHFAVLEAMIKARDNEHALSYLREYMERVEEATTPPVCNNAVADAVCRRYIALARQRKIQTDVAADIPQQPGVADSDLAMLLRSLWENALEACERQSDGQRYIRLRAKVTGNSLMISMTNSFDGVTRSRVGKDGEPVLLSLKRGGTEEGVGLPFIHAIVKRYQGLDEVTYDTSSFNVKILLYAEGGSKLL